MKDYCVSCDQKREGSIDEDLGQFKCFKCQEAQERYLADEQQRDQEYFQSLSPEAQDELKAEYALAGVSDAREWFGY